MNERERVLDLVKKGVLSTEEALDLLESMATKKDEEQIQQANEKVTAEKHDDLDTLLQDDEPADHEAELKQKQAEDKQQLEEILDSLATKANQASAELDEVNVEIDGVKKEIKDAQMRLMELNTKEELDALDEEELEERQEIEAELKELEASLEELVEERINLEAQLKSIKKDQWSQTKEKTKEKINSKIDLPDDWKEQASDALNQASEKMVEAGTHLGRLLKKTFQTVSETVNDNVEWKDISLKVPGMAATKFEHTFEYDETAATIIDVKVANGDIQLKAWDEPGVKVDAKIKLYGKMTAATPFDAFSERSQITVDDDHISFQVPNKRVRADLTFYLPRRMYDHVSIKLLNGDVLVNELEAKDVYTKSTNGSIDFQMIQATMLEIDGVNGSITVRDGKVLDSIIETVNGTVTMTTTPQTLGVSLVNGDIRLTLNDTNVKRIDASSVNGNVKIAVPVELSMEGEAKTSLGSINSRMTDYEVVREKKDRMNQMLQFRRITDEELAQIQLSTTTGSIFLKNTDK